MNPQQKNISKNILLTMLTASVLLGRSSVAAAENNLEEFTLAQMVVTATRTMKDAQKVPASVTVITAAEIKEKNVMTVTDALKNSMGVFVDRPKGIADVSGGINIRGFSDSDILVLYDGMPMNNAYDGGVVWNAIPIDSIERIEIVRGAASSLYGGRAVGAVINIISKEPKGGKVKVRVNTLYGSNDTWRRGLTVSQKPTDKLSYSLGYEHRSTGGFQNKVASTTASGFSSATGTIGTGVVVSEKTNGNPRYIIGSVGDGAGKSDTYNTKLKYDFTENKNLTYAYTHDTFKYWTDNPETYIYDAEGNPLFTGSVQLPNGKWYNFSESAFTDYKGRRTTDVHSLKYEDADNKFIVNAGFTDVKDSGYSTGSYFNGNTAGNDISYPSKSYKIDFQKIWDKSFRHTVVAGGSWQKDEMTRTGASLSHWNDYTSVTGVNSITGGKDVNFALFLQDEYKISDKWKAYSGIRFDHYKKYDGYFWGKTTGMTKYDKAAYNELSPKLSLEYEKDTSTIYYISYGHSFNPPSLYQLYRTDDNEFGNGYIGNPDLKPEKTNTFEIGMKKNFGKKTKLNINLYHANTDDLIAVKTLDVNGVTQKQYQNIDKAKRIGTELDITHKFDKKWGSYLNYTWERVEDSNGDRVYGYPQDIFHTGIRYHQDKWTANFDVEHISDRNDPGDVSGVYLSYDGFTIANLGTKYDITPKISATFSINNIFDKKYYLWYAAPVRTYTLGLQFEF
ncbi:MAG: TonB-dependent receptor [Acidaminococcaceae bacterium]|nr:TonB-dependent receptor [Acidaminococcaceae bacterium]